MKEVSAIFKSIQNSKLSDKRKQELKEDALNIFNALVDYVDFVVRMDLYIASIVYPDSVTDAKVNSLDKQRSSIHNNCIQCCHKLNEICNEIGVPTICDFDLSDRYQVADFCGAVVGAMFLTDRESSSFDAIIEKFTLTNTVISHSSERD